MLLLSWCFFVFCLLVFFFLPFSFFGFGVPGRCLHAAAWLFVLLPVGINAGFPTQCQSTLSAVHPGRLEDLAGRERKNTACHSAAPRPRAGVPHTACPGRQGPALPARLPGLHVVQTGRTHAMKHLVMWRCGQCGVAHAQSHTMGGQKWSALSGSIPLTSGEPQLALTSPAAHCPIPASGRQGTGSWSFPQGQLHTFGTRSQQPLPRDCFGAACAGWKAVCCLFQHVTPLGRTRQPPLHLLLVVFGLQLRQWESLRTVIKVLLEWKITPCTPKRRFTQGGPAQPAESGTRWAPIHFCIFHTHTHWVTHTHIRTLTKTYALCMYYIYAHTCTHRNN